MIKNPFAKITLAVGIFLVLCIALLTLKNGIDRTEEIEKVADSVLYLEIFDNMGNLTKTASGFIAEDGGVLVTNYHVINNAYRIDVKSSNGQKLTSLSTILAYDETSDLAILRCDEALDIEPLVLGESDQTRQGDSIYAVGYPLGLANTLSDGIISSRYVDENGVDTLQITAAISPGSSGGALLNEQGQVVGVICASYSEGQNLNLAIASNVLKSLLVKASEETEPITLEAFYESFNRAYPTEYVLINHSSLDGENICVTGYISSAFAYSAGEATVVDYYLVADPEDVLSYDFDDGVYDLDDFIVYMREENRRHSNYGLITFEANFSKKLEVSPGDYVMISGTVNDNKTLRSLSLDECILM